MEDFAPRTYGTSGLDNRPLFGETSAKDRIINLVVGSLTTLLILVTLISAFVFPQLPPKPLNIFFAVCISLSSITACILGTSLLHHYETSPGSITSKNTFLHKLPGLEIHPSGLVTGPGVIAEMNLTMWTLVFWNLRAGGKDMDLVLAN